MLRYNGNAVWKKSAAIAQPVERILGKDEVASSNLASSSKPLNLLEVQGFFFSLEREPPAMQEGKKEFYLCPENKPPDDRE